MLCESPCAESASRLELNSALKALQEVENAASDEGLLNCPVGSIFKLSSSWTSLWVCVMGHACLSIIYPLYPADVGKRPDFWPLETAFLTGQDAAQLAAVLHSNSAQAWWQAPKPKQWKVLDGNPAKIQWCKQWKSTHTHTCTRSLLVRNDPGADEAKEVAWGDAAFRGNVGTSEAALLESSRIFLMVRDGQRWSDARQSTDAMQPCTQSMSRLPRQSMSRSRPCALTVATLSLEPWHCLR